jgi:hypothetical protein
MDEDGFEQIQMDGKKNTKAKKKNKSGGFQSFGMY